MTYNREEFVFIGEEPSFLAHDFVSIGIVSDAAFDETHPAGTSLADIVIYDSQSSKPFIDSGYQMYYWDDDNRFDDHYTLGGDGLHPFYPVYKKLSEVTTDDLKLIY